jgi:hypothetical protein
VEEKEKGGKVREREREVKGERKEERGREWK